MLTLKKKNKINFQSRPAEKNKEGQVKKGKKFQGQKFLANGMPGGPKICPDKKLLYPLEDLFIWIKKKKVITILKLVNFEF